MPYDDEQLDNLLERGLREYARIEPRDGLEERIVANLRGQPEPRRWWRVWIPALAAVAVIAIVGAVGLRPNRPTTNGPEPSVASGSSGQAHSPGSQPAASAIASASSPGQPVAGNHGRVGRGSMWHGSDSRTTQARVVPRSPIHAAQALPRMAVFPAPTPLTEQERLVLALMRHAPEVAAQVGEIQEMQRERADYYLRNGSFPEDSGPSNNPQK